MALGFGQGSSENHEICEALFRGLSRRGLVLSKRILFVTDGGSGLRKALRERFGQKLVPQRFAIHTSRNLQRYLAKPYHNEAHRQLKTALEQTRDPAAKHMLRELEAWLRTQSESGGGFAPGGVGGTIDGASAEGAGEAAQNAAVDQPEREPVLAGPAQRTEYHAFTRERDAPTLAGDGVALLRAAVYARERGCRDCASHGSHRSRSEYFNGLIDNLNSQGHCQKNA